MRPCFLSTRHGLLLTLVLLLAGSPARGGSASKAPPIPADRAANSYAIYSLLIPGELIQGLPPEQKQRLAIADTTVSIAEMNPAVPPDGQLKAPPENSRAFYEALQDYHARRDQRFHLSRSFHLNQDYVLLTSDEVDEIRRARGDVNPGSELQSKYAGFPGVILLSQVFFNPNQTAALVYVNEWCANLCSSGTWVYLEKHGNAWTRRSGVSQQP